MEAFWLLLSFELLIIGTGKGQNQDDLQIVNGDNYRKGRLEIFHNNEWGTICDDYGRTCKNFGNVACSQLGFPGCSVVHSYTGSGGSGTTAQMAFHDPIAPPDRIWLDDVNCVGTEAKIGVCAHSTWGAHNCQHGEDISIECWGNTNIAKFYLHCDNQFWAHVSYDGGLPGTWETIASGDDWRQLNKFEVANPTSQTLVDIWCQNNGGIGGFIATMSYNGIEYPTTNPLIYPFSAGHWEILGSTASPPFSTDLTAVAPSSLVYNAKGSGAWGSHIKSPHISSQAYWVWDGQVNNVLYFRVNFGRIIGNLVPINDPPTDFIKYDGPNDAIFSFNISQSALIGIGSLILVLIIVNVVMICIHWNSKNKQKGYHKVKYMDTDTEAELA